MNDTLRRFEAAAWQLYRYESDRLHTLESGACPDKLPHLERRWLLLALTALRDEIANATGGAGAYEAALADLVTADCRALQQWEERWRALRQGAVTVGCPIVAVVDLHVLLHGQERPQEGEQAGRIFSDLARPMVENLGRLQSLAERSGGTSPAPTGEKIARALGELARHPEWSNRQIAAAAGCNAKYLSQSEDFKTARAAIKGAGQESHQRAARHRGNDMDAYSDT